MKTGIVIQAEFGTLRPQFYWISGYFWGAEGLSEDLLKPKEEEFGVGHPA